MKKALILVFLFTSYFVKADGLESDAQFIKDKYPNEYTNTIRKHALEEWKDDYEMVVYEINQQSNALINLVENFKSDNTNIAFKAIQEWSVDGYLSLGHLLYYTDWETTRSVITIALYGENYEITNAIEYLGKELKSFENNINEQKVLNDF